MVRKDRFQTEESSKREESLTETSLKMTKKAFLNGECYMQRPVFTDEEKT